MKKVIILSIKRAYPLSTHYLANKRLGYHWLFIFFFKKALALEGKKYIFEVMLSVVFLQLTKAVVIRSHALAPQFIEKVSYMFDCKCPFSKLHSYKY